MGRIGIKICGIKTVEAGQAAMEAGADALGFVFFAKSPRNISPENTRRICDEIGGNITRVGVFVNEPFETLIETVEKAELDFVQIHGNEPLDLIKKLLSRGIGVIKGVFHSKEPGFDSADSLHVENAKMAFLAECGKGKLPGGNAAVWDFKAAKELCRKYPTLLAGGLTSENVAEAILAALPAAVDVSSGVEASPGVKDLNKIRVFIREVRAVENRYNPVFHNPF